MDDLRAIIAMFVGGLSAYLVYDLFVNGFSWTLLIFVLAGFWFVHVIWPNTRDRESHWYDLFESIFDFPYRTIAFALRSLFRSDRDGSGFDISD